MTKKTTTAILLILAVAMVLFFTFQDSEGTTRLSESVRQWLEGYGIKAESHALRIIRKVSLVLVDTNTHFEDLAEGDAIVFRINSTEVLHRVTGSEGESVVAEPDNGDGEALVHKSMYVGKEIAAIPVIGGWVQWISRNAWVVVVVGAALVVIGCLPLSFRRR